MPHESTVAHEHEQRLSKEDFKEVKIIVGNSVDEVSFFKFLSVSSVFKFTQWTPEIGVYIVFHLVTG